MIIMKKMPDFYKVCRIVNMLKELLKELLDPHQDLHLDLFSHQKLITCSLAHSITFHLLLLKSVNKCLKRQTNKHKQKHSLHDGAYIEFFVSSPLPELVSVD